MQNRIVFVQLPYPAVLIYMDRENIFVKLIKMLFPDETHDHLLTRYYYEGDATMNTVL